MKDYNWVKNRFGTKFANILRGIYSDAIEGGEEIRKHFTIKENGNVSFEDLEKNNHELISREGFTEVLDESFDSVFGNKAVVKITWQELKNLRDSNELIPGSLYRITDYNCTTTQENTRSAGHQFDIVLLALSADKLAEEGWAMMHDNIYDVTFSDGVTKKCYIYYGAGGGEYNIADVETLLGINDEPAEYVTINENTKTAIIDEESSAMAEDVSTYNYFQNSNLSAWKVWYSLDNDADRFAWAANIVVASSSGNSDHTQIINQPMIAIGSTDDEVMTYVRTPYLDNQNGYAWCYNGDGEDFSVNSTSDTFDNEDVLYTPTENPIIGSTITQDAGEETYSYKVVALSVGTGVIYRLIDEFNNDVPYDFKNIQLLKQVYNGTLVESGGIEMYVYTFTFYDADGGELFDASIEGNRRIDQDDFCRGVFCNKIEASTAECIELDPYLGISKLVYIINNIAIYVAEDQTFLGTNNVNISSNCYNININSGSNISISSRCQNIYISGGEIYLGDKTRNCTIKGQSIVLAGSNGDIVINKNCSNINIGIASYRLEISEGSKDIYIDSGCRDIYFQKKYFRNVVIAKGTTYLNLTSSQTTSLSMVANNINIGLGFYGTNATPKVISHNTLATMYQTTYLPTNSTTINV